MELKVEIQQVFLKQEAQYFILCECSEEEYPQPPKLSYQRTEIQCLSSNPQFMKNVFRFESLDITNRIAVKLGIYNTQMNESDPKINNVMDYSRLFCWTNIILTQKMIREIKGRQTAKTFTYDMISANQSQSQHVGKLSIHMSLFVDNLVDKFNEDLEKIENIYYDPMLTDQSQIKQMLHKVKNMLQQKDTELKHYIQKRDYVFRIAQDITKEKQELEDQAEQLKKENTEVVRRMNKLQNVDELEIQMEMLGQSEQGRAILREKLARLTQRLQLQKAIYDQQTEVYFGLEGQLKHSKRLKQQIVQLKDASKQQQFHFALLDDKLKIINGQKQQIWHLEQTIQCLQGQIKKVMNGGGNLDRLQIDLDLKYMRHMVGYLREKTKQIEGIRQLNDGNIPYKDYLKVVEDLNVKDHNLINTAYANENESIQYYEEKSQEYLKQIEVINRQLQQQRTGHKITINEQQHDKVAIMRLEYDRLQNYQIQLEEQIKKNSKDYAVVIVQLKQKQADLDAIINRFGKNLQQ